MHESNGFETNEIERNIGVQDNAYAPAQKCGLRLRMEERQSLNIVATCKGPSFQGEQVETVICTYWAFFEKGELDSVVAPWLSF